MRAHGNVGIVDEQKIVLGVHCQLRERVLTLPFVPSTRGRTHTSRIGFPLRGISAFNSLTAAAAGSLERCDAEEQFKLARIILLELRVTAKCVQHTGIKNAF